MAIILVMVIYARSEKQNPNQSMASMGKGLPQMHITNGKLERSVDREKDHSIARKQ